MIVLDQLSLFARFARQFSTHSAETANEYTLPVPSTWHSAVVEDLSVAQEMLDRLEFDGHQERQLRILANTRFEVRWK